MANFLDRRAQHVRIVTSGKRAEAAEPERRDAAASRVAFLMDPK